MESDSLGLCAALPPCEACPFRAEIVDARQQAGYWKDCHQRARDREDQLQQEIERLQAEVKKLERELFGRSSEKGHSGKSLIEPGTSRRRGQQPGNPGPVRRDTSHLSSEEEWCSLAPEECHCARCGLPFEEFPGTEDSEIIEIDVRATSA